MAENNFYPVQNNRIESIDTERGSAFVDLAGLEYFWNNAKEYIDTGDINANNVYTTDFAFGNLVRGRATASRELLDAVKNGKIIRVPIGLSTDNEGYVIVDATVSVTSGKKDILYISCVHNYLGFPGYVYTHAEFNTDTTSAPLTVLNDKTLPTNPDWSINWASDPNYIANRTHYHNQRGIFRPGQRFSIADQETTHDLNNYRLLLKGDLFKIQEGQFSIEKDGASIDFNCARSESGKTVTWTLTSTNPIGFEENEYITVASKLGDYKPLDEFYLPDNVGRVYRTDFSFTDMQKAQTIKITRELVEAILDKKIIVIPHYHNDSDTGCYIANCYCVKGTDGISGYLEVTANRSHCQASFRLLNSEIIKQTSVTVTSLQPALSSGNNIKTINGASILGSGNIELITDIESILVSDIESLTYTEE